MPATYHHALPCPKCGANTVQVPCDREGEPDFDGWCRCAAAGCGWAGWYPNGTEKVHDEPKAT